MHNLEVCTEWTFNSFSRHVKMAKKRIGFLPSNNSHGIIQRMREKTSGEDDEPEIIFNLDKE